MILIDGSFGEGGGQILRTSLSLSLITGKAFRIEKIRAGRKQPGLLRQHLTAVLAAAEVGGAEVQGAALGSTALEFRPGAVRPGEYHFAVGTAGSGTLVLQTILPPLMIGSKASRVVIEGGTHNTAAPPVDFLVKTFLPLITRMGPRVHLQLERYGFYPAGGGRFSVDIHPVASLKALHLGERGVLTSRRVRALVANLPRHIAAREVDSATNELEWEGMYGSIEETAESSGPGNIVMIEIGTDEVTEVFSSFGERGVPAEKVGRNAAREANAWLASRACACEHLTDQLLLPLALAEGSFTALSINLHAQTNMSTIGRFLPVSFATEPREGCTFVQVSGCQ